MGHASEEGAHALSHVSEHLHEVVAGHQKAWRWVILASVLALQEFIIASFQRSTDALTEKNARRLERLTKGEIEGDWQAFLQHFDDLYRQIKREHDYEPGEDIDHDLVDREGLASRTSGIG